MATSFSGGGSWREPPTMGKQLVSLITCGCELGKGKTHMHTNRQNQSATGKLEKS
jgi:hypothetical protein